MNIYFACTITGGREYESVYRAIVRSLREDGHEVPTAHLAESNVLARETEIAPREVYERDIAWIRACDALIAEVSVPSHGVGYEIGFALSIGKPVLALHQKDRRLSKMISGNPDPRLKVAAYHSLDEAIRIIREFLWEKR
ncbi:MAG TPA: nucleoside 2-deoxyribosyltransferase [Anaerolineales bacterium]|nr:nucleoside 2-deoxyribosyltransferase [Anaerolineales bacterium]